MRRHLGAHGLCPGAGLAAGAGAGVLASLRGGEVPGAAGALHRRPRALHDHHPHRCLRLCRRLPAHAPDAGLLWRHGPGAGHGRPCPHPAYPALHAPHPGSGPEAPPRGPLPLGPGPRLLQASAPAALRPAGSGPHPGGSGRARLRQGCRRHPAPADAGRQRPPGAGRALCQPAHPVCPHGHGNGQRSGRGRLQLPLCRRLPAAGRNGPGKPCPAPAPSASWPWQPAWRSSPA